MSRKFGVTSRLFRIPARAALVFSMALAALMAVAATASATGGTNIEMFGADVQFGTSQYLLCLDAPSISAGQVLQSVVCNSTSANQQFTVAYNSIANNYQLEIASGGVTYCATGVQNRTGTWVELEPCNNTWAAYQTWDIYSSHIQNIFYGGCMDTQSESNASGASVVVNTCNGGQSQSEWINGYAFQFETPNNHGTAECLTATNSTTVELEPCTPITSSNQFKLSWGAIVSVAYGTCVYWTGGTAPSDLGLSGTCGGDYATWFTGQQWPSGGSHYSYFSLENLAYFGNDGCLDVDGDNDSSNQPVDFYTCNQTQAQYWRVGW